jgi:hypothetical protein
MVTGLFLIIARTILNYTNVGKASNQINEIIKGVFCNEDESFVIS